MGRLIKSEKVDIYVVQLWDKTDKNSEYNYIVDAFKNGRPLEHCAFFKQQPEAETHYKKTIKIIKNEAKKKKRSKANSGRIQGANRTRAWKFIQWFKRSDYESH